MQWNINYELFTKVTLEGRLYQFFKVISSLGNPNLCFKVIFVKIIQDLGLGKSEVKHVDDHWDF